VDVAATSAEGSDWKGVTFINPTTTAEVVAAVLDRCDITETYWVFANPNAAVEYSLSVTDTQTGEVKTYSNELGQASPAIIDTNAFRTCVDDPDISDGS
jgi:hypothetical protein